MPHSFFWRCMISTWNAGRSMTIQLLARDDAMFVQAMCLRIVFAPPPPFFLGTVEHGVYFVAYFTAGAVTVFRRWGLDWKGLELKVSK